MSVPERKREIVNDVVLVRGRYIEPGRSDEAIISQGFADANRLDPGDTVGAILNGRRRDLEVVGVGLSPEYVYTIRPGEIIPDNTRFGVFWMGRRALAAAFDMEGGFNDVSLLLRPGTQVERVIQELDELLRPYGGWGAIPRDLQLSHWSVQNELISIRVAGVIIPMVFLGVAAFLLHVVLHRIVAVQREQIATLKALGYSRLSIALHYTYWALAISLTGTLIGTVCGSLLGRGMLSMYNDFFRFPVLEYRLDPVVVAGAVVLGIAAAVFGARTSVRRAVRLQPAEAMRPEPPAKYSASLVERLGLRRLLSQPARIILRNIERQPVRSAITIGGIALSLAVLIVGMFAVDSLDLMMDMQFRVAQRQDLQLTFTEPVSPDGIYSLQRLPGVIMAEPVLSVPVRLTSGQRSRQLSVMGLPNFPELFRVIDVGSLKPVDLSHDGVVLAERLADVLDVRPGESITAEVLIGSRAVRELPVASTVRQHMGLAAYMNIDSVRRLLHHDKTLSGGYLTVDSQALPDLFRAIKETPAIAGSGLKAAALKSFQETFAANLGIMIFFNVLFASIIAFGVVYNAARVSLAERSRELASLRVMGFTRKEISAILLGELGILALLALPLGLLLGYALTSLLTKAMETELYALPFSVVPSTYAACALTVLGATVVSGLIVRRKLDRLDLLEVLKAKE